MQLQPTVLVLPGQSELNLVIVYCYFCQTHYYLPLLSGHCQIILLSYMCEQLFTVFMTFEQSGQKRVTAQS